jgi:peptidyl-lysine (3S)-dioxygenase / protease
MLIKPVNHVTIDELGDPDERFDQKSEPLVIAGGGRDWQCTRTWTLSSLAERFRQVRIPVRESDDEFKEFFERPNSHLRPRKMILFGDYITILQNRGSGVCRPPYAGNMSLSRDPALSGNLRNLIAECPFPNWLPHCAIDEYRLWIGAEGQRSTIHNDAYHNFNLQVMGEKSIFIYPPDQHDMLYAEYFNPGMWVSPVEPDAPDLTKYPKYADAIIYKCYLTQGDILFLPRFWWHAVSATAVSINVNRWVFSSNGADDWWHKQDIAQPFIHYHQLMQKIFSQFNSLPKDVQTYQRSDFEKIIADLQHLAQTRTTG